MNSIGSVHDPVASPNPAVSPSTNSPRLEGISRIIAMIGPSRSIASENRSTMSREPVRSSEFTSTRHRSQMNARKMRVTSEPVEVDGGTLAADELDEHL